MMRNLYHMRKAEQCVMAFAVQEDQAGAAHLSRVQRERGHLQAVPGSACACQAWRRARACAGRMREPQALLSL